MKCRFNPIEEHIIPPVCNCDKLIHLWNGKVCVCISRKYCKDAVKTVDQNPLKKVDLSKFT